MAGLTLISENQRDPTRTTSFGTGQLIRAALDCKPDQLLILLGGSATCDGGAGIAQALGARFFDRRDELIRTPTTGGDLLRIDRVEPPTIETPMVVACDVTNRLLGPTGAAPTFAPQKGATPEQVEQLERGLAHLHQLLGSPPDQPGCGAAGGAAFGLAAFCGATLKLGIDVVLDAVRFDDRCAGVDLVITGEGCLDEQSLMGKACMGVARRAASLGKPTLAIVGTTGPGAENCLTKNGGFLDDYVALTDLAPLDDAIRDPAPLIEAAATQLVSRWLDAQR